MNSKPQVLAWITCDGVHIDPGSGKQTILGVFSNIRAREFPVKHPFMVWFLALSDVSEGQHVLRISMGIDPTKMRQIIERNFESHGPLERIYRIEPIRDLQFDEPGDYSIIIEVDDEPVLATNINVTN